MCSGLSELAGDLCDSNDFLYTNMLKGSSINVQYMYI